MKRLEAIAWLALAFAGCGTGREIRPSDHAFSPVGETPLPSLHDQINAEQGQPGRAEAHPARPQNDPGLLPPRDVMSNAPPHSVPALPWRVPDAVAGSATKTPAPLASTQTAPLDSPAPPPGTFPATSPPSDPGFTLASGTSGHESDGPPNLTASAVLDDQNHAQSAASFQPPSTNPEFEAPPPFPSPFEDSPPANPPADSPVQAVGEPPASASPVSTNSSGQPTTTPDPASMAALATPPPGKPVGEWAARVNDDIITWNELQSAVRLRLRDLPAEESRAAEVREFLVVSVLDNLIDRTLILQHARRHELKNPKAWEHFNKIATQVWEKEQEPILLKKLQAKDRYELERKLMERGDSLHDIQEAFRHDFIARQYLIQKVGPKIHVDLPEIRSYYHEHRGHEKFHRPEQITWREILVDVRNHPDRPSARAKAEQALARLRRGEDFARVAAEMGEGPNAAQGGLWEKTTPDSYSVPAVNLALMSQSPGLPSPILEGPDSYHIVRVEEHTQAGPMSFAEVQLQIRDILNAEKQATAMENYLKDLYRGAVITTVFREYVPRDRRNASH